MLLVVDELIAVHPLVMDGVEEGVDGAVAVAGDLEDRVLMLKPSPEMGVGHAVFHVGAQTVVNEPIGPVHLEVFVLEQLVDGVRLQLHPRLVRGLLNDSAELRVHGLGHIKSELVVHNKGGPALAGLGVDAHRLIGSAQILRVNGEIGHHPLVRPGLLHVVKALVDGVLMTAREGGKDQIAGVGLPGGNRHLGAALVHGDNALHMAEIQFRVNALDVHIHGNRDHVHIAGALAVSEEAGLHPLRAGKQSGFCGSHAAAPVVVGVEGDDGPLPAGEIADKILHLVGKLVGHTVLHGGGKVEDDPVVSIGVEVIQHGGADLHGGVHLGAHKGFRGVFIPQIDSGGDD